jgi:Protein of unknown function (DUF4256)
MLAAPTGTLLSVLSARFQAHPKRHFDMDWAYVEARLSPAALAALQAMDASGGEPDVIGRDAQTGEILFCDCSAESPAGRRSLCYDGDARRARKEHAPASSALEQAAEFGVELLDEAQYRALQQLGPFDTKTSSWLRTPPAMRTLGGALFGDWRYGQVFAYHNGVQSYYAARGWRGLLRV